MLEVSIAAAVTEDVCFMWLVCLHLNHAFIVCLLIILLSAVVGQWLIIYFFVSVCLSLYNQFCFCRQDILQSNLRIFAKSIADTPYMLP